MRSRVILGLAGVCGAAAFLWILFAQPRRSPDRPSLAVSREPVRTRAEAEKAVMERPNDFVEWHVVATLRESKDAAAALQAWREAERSADTYAASESPLSARAMFYLGWAREKLGYTTTARAAFEAAAKTYEAGLAPDGRFNGRYQAWMRLAWCRQKLGYPEKARDAWDRALELIDRTHPTELSMAMAYDRACCEAQRSEPGNALWSLQKAAERGFKDYEWAAADEHLAPLRADPRFTDWLGKGAGGGG